MLNALTLNICASMSQASPNLLNNSPTHHILKKLSDKPSQNLICILSSKHTEYEYTVQVAHIMFHIHKDYNFLAMSKTTTE